jgi:hypothetical protein
MAAKPFHERIIGGVVGIAGEAHGAGKIDRAVIREIARRLREAYPQADFDTGVNYMQGSDTIIIEHEPGEDADADAAEMVVHQRRIAAMIAAAFTTAG